MSEYRSRSRISRQFTDAESALDDRVTSHLTAPPLELVTGDSHSQSYQWLREDLALRSVLSKQLAGEQAMAYAQSERHELARQALDQEDQDADALIGARRVRELMDAGDDPDIAVYKAVGENERLAFNSVFGKVAGDAARLFQSPEQLALRQQKEDLDVIRTKNALALAREDAEVNEDSNLRAKRIRAKINVADLNAQTAPLHAQLAHINASTALLKAEEDAALIQKLGGDYDEDTAIEVQGLFNEMGLTGVVDPIAVAKVASRSQYTMAMLRDDGWRAEFLNSPERQALFEASLNTIANPDATRVEMTQAQAAVRTATSEWLKANRSTIKRQEAFKVMSEVSKDFVEPWQKLAKEIDAIVQEPVKNMPARNKPAAMLNTFARFIPSTTGQGADEVVAKYTRMVGEKLAEANQKGSKLDVPATNEFISATGLAFSQEFKAAKARAMMGKGAIGMAAKAADAASPVKVSTPEEAAKLPPGTVFVGPDGVTRTRP
jgi:hypothetical protein